MPDLSRFKLTGTLPLKFEGSLELCLGLSVGYSSVVVTACSSSAVYGGWNFGEGIPKFEWWVDPAFFLVIVAD